MLSRLVSSPSAAVTSRRLPRSLHVNQCRTKHSERQVRRLFKDNPARLRVEARRGVDRTPPPLDPPTFPPVVDNVKILESGWSAPPSEDVEIPEYPFRIRRTQNKPNEAVGFLPVCK